MRSVELDSYWGWVARCRECNTELGPGGEQGFRWRTRDCARTVVLEHKLFHHAKRLPAEQRSTENDG